MIGCAVLFLAMAVVPSFGATKFSLKNVLQAKADAKNEFAFLQTGVKTPTLKDPKRLEITKSIETLNAFGSVLEEQPSFQVLKINDNPRTCWFIPGVANELYRDINVVDRANHRGIQAVGKGIAGLVQAPFLIAAGLIGGVYAAGNGAYNAASGAREAEIKKLVETKKKPDSEFKALGRIEKNAIQAALAAFKLLDNNYWGNIKNGPLQHKIEENEENKSCGKIIYLWYPSLKTKWDDEKMQDMVKQFLTGGAGSDITFKTGDQVVAHSMGNLVLAGAIINGKFNIEKKNEKLTCYSGMSPDEENENCGPSFVSLAAPWAGSPLAIAVAEICKALAYSTAGDAKKQLEIRIALSSIPGATRAFQSLVCADDGGDMVGSFASMDPNYEGFMGGRLKDKVKSHVKDSFCGTDPTGFGMTISAAAQSAGASFLLGYVFPLLLALKDRNDLALFQQTKDAMEKEGNDGLVDAPSCEIKGKSKMMAANHKDLAGSNGEPVACGPQNCIIELVAADLLPADDEEKKEGEAETPAPAYKQSGSKDDIMNKLLWLEIKKNLAKPPKSPFSFATNFQDSVFGIGDLGQVFPLVFIGGTFGRDHPRQTVINYFFKEGKTQVFINYMKNGKTLISGRISEVDVKKNDPVVRFTMTTTILHWSRQGQDEEKSGTRPSTKKVRFPSAQDAQDFGTFFAGRSVERHIKTKGQSVEEQKGEEKDTPSPTANQKEKEKEKDEKS